MFTLIHFLFILNHYMHWSNWPSHVQVVLKKSAVLIFFCNCLGIFLCWFHAVDMDVLIYAFVDFLFLWCVAMLQHKHPAWCVTITVTCNAAIQNYEKEKQ
jgi:hypothetical protein